MTSELEILSTVDHPHIMRIFELLEDEVNYYIISECIYGGDLFDYTQKNGTNLNLATITKILK